MVYLHSWQQGHHLVETGIRNLRGLALPKWTQNELVSADRLISNIGCRQAVKMTAPAPASGDHTMHCIKLIRSRSCQESWERDGWQGERAAMSMIGL